jgi:urease accessory protein
LIAAPKRAGHGRVQIERSGARSALVALTTRSPLKILAPKSYGGAAWIVVASYGGGLVDGDELDLELSVGVGARAFLTTQASTKVYPGSSGQTVTARVGDEALLVSLPDPVVGFAGSRYRQRARIELAASASLVWLESLTSGRAARGERWLFDGYRAHTAIDRAGKPLARDGLVLDAAHGSLLARLGSFDALATLIVAGPACRALRDHLLGGAVSSGPALIAPSPLGGGGSGGDDAAVVRLAARSAEALARALARLLVPIADLLGEDPLARKLVGDNALR